MEIKDLNLYYTSATWNLFFRHLFRFCFFSFYIFQASIWRILQMSLIFFSFSLPPKIFYVRISFQNEIWVKFSLPLNFFFLCIYSVKLIRLQKEDIPSFFLSLSRILRSNITRQVSHLINCLFFLSISIFNRQINFLFQREKKIIQIPFKKDFEISNHLKLFDT